MGDVVPEVREVPIMAKAAKLTRPGAMSRIPSVTSDSPAFSNLPRIRVPGAISIGLVPLPGAVGTFKRVRKPRLGILNL